MMKWTKCAVRFLRISRPGVRVPSIAPENAVKSKDFMAFLFCKPWVHGFCTVFARSVFSMSDDVGRCIALQSVPSFASGEQCQAQLCLHFRVGILEQLFQLTTKNEIGNPSREVYLIFSLGLFCNNLLFHSSNKSPLLRADEHAGPRVRPGAPSQISPAFSFSSTSSSDAHSMVYSRFISASAGTRSGTMTVTKPPAAPARTPL